jgi:hypothetical protein
MQVRDIVFRRDKTAAPQIHKYTQVMKMYHREEEVKSADICVQATRRTNV